MRYGWHAHRCREQCNNRHLEEVRSSIAPHGTHNFIQVRGGESVTQLPLEPVAVAAENLCRRTKSCVQIQSRFADDDLHASLPHVAAPSTRSKFLESVPDDFAFRTDTECDQNGHRFFSQPRFRHGYRVFIPNISSGFSVWRLSPTHLGALGKAATVGVSMHGELESIDDGENRQRRRATKHGSYTL